MCKGKRKDLLQGVAATPYEQVLLAGRNVPAENSDGIHFISMVLTIPPGHNVNRENRDPIPPWHDASGGGLHIIFL